MSQHIYIYNIYIYIYIYICVNIHIYVSKSWRVELSFFKGRFRRCNLLLGTRNSIPMEHCSTLSQGVASASNNVVYIAHYSVPTMEVEYSGGGVLIFSYLILIHQLDNFGGLGQLS